MMIIREWRGRASLAEAEAYRAHFRAKVAPELVNLPGFVGAHLSRRPLGDRIEFLVLTRWKSMDAIGTSPAARLTRPSSSWAPPRRSSILTRRSSTMRSSRRRSRRPSDDNAGLALA